MKKYYSLLVIMYLLIICPVLSANPKIVVGGSSELKSTIYGIWSEMIYREAFKRLNYDFEYVSFPTARVKYQFIKGKLDGEINRISSYNDGRDNLLRVEEAHFTMKNIAYFTDPELLIESWDSFDKIEKHVEYRKGSKILHDKIEPRVSRQNRSTVTTATQGMKRVLLGRTDIYIELEGTAHFVLNKLGENYDINKFQPPVVLHEENSYLFLHNRYHVLAGNVSLEIIKMKKEGVIEELRLLALKKYSIEQVESN